LIAAIIKESLNFEDEISLRGVGCNIPLNSKQTSVSVEHVKEEIVMKGKMVILSIIL